jgi:glucosyl-3-phosphoglycerate synthase
VEQDVVAPMSANVERWYRTRTTSFQDWPKERVAALKRGSGAKVSLLLRTGDASVTGREQLLAGGLVDEVIEVIPQATGYPALAEPPNRASAPCSTPPDQGWGTQLSRALVGAAGDLIVMIDSRQTVNYGECIPALIGQSLANKDVKLVKGFPADRPSPATQHDQVTELVVRPILSLDWPELTGLIDPLSGDWSARRELLDEVPIPVGNGSALSLLLDCYQRYGLSAIAQVGLRTRRSACSGDAGLALFASELYAAANRRRDTSAFERIEPAGRELVSFANSPAILRRQRLHTVELAPLKARRANRAG